MHVVVSMYLETVASLRIVERLPQTAAEERRTSRACGIIALLPSCLLEPDEKGLELRRPRVRVHRGGRQEIRERAGVASGAGGVSPVERESDLPERLAVDLQGAQTLGDHRGSLERSARRGDLDLGAVGDALLPGERLRDLDEEPRLELVQDLRVLRPVVVVLGEPVRRADDGEVLAIAVDVL